MPGVEIPEKSNTPACHRQPFVSMAVEAERSGLVPASRAATNRRSAMGRPATPIVRAVLPPPDRLGPDSAEDASPPRADQGGRTRREKPTVDHSEEGGGHQGGETHAGVLCQGLCEKLVQDSSAEERRPAPAGSRGGTPCVVGGRLFGDADVSFIVPWGAVGERPDFLAGRDSPVVNGPPEEEPN